MKGICQKHPQEDIDRTGYCDACIAEKGSPLATDPTHLTNPEREAVGNAAIDDVNEWGNTQPIAKCLPRTNAAIERILTARLSAQQPPATGKLTDAEITLIDGAAVAFDGHVTIASSLAVKEEVERILTARLAAQGALLNKAKTVCHAWANYSASLNCYPEPSEDYRESARKQLGDAVFVLSTLIHSPSASEALAAHVKPLVEALRASQLLGQRMADALWAVERGKPHEDLTMLNQDFYQEQRKLAERAMRMQGDE